MPTFKHLGQKTINLDHITYIDKVKGENGNYYNLYTAGRLEWLFQFKEDSTEGKALRRWLEIVSPLAHTNDDI